MIHDSEPTGGMEGESALSSSSKMRSSFQASSVQGKSNFLLNYDGAIDKMREEFNKYRPDIIRNLSNKDGSVDDLIPIEDFCKWIYEVTSNISKNQIQVIAMRFCDKDVKNVTVPEYLEFFMTPSQVHSSPKCMYKSVFAPLLLYSSTPLHLCNSTPLHLSTTHF